MKNLVVCVLLLLSACTRAVDTSKADTLRVRISGEPPSLDWQKADDTTSDLILENIMEGLVRYDFTGGTVPKLVPALATEWQSSNHGLKWKILLRKNVKWSDGVPFTAQHVVDAWKRTLTPTTAAPYARFLLGVKNARAFYEGKGEWKDVAIRAPNDFEIDVELEKTLAYFPYLFAHFSLYPIRLDVIAKYSDHWTDPENLVTLGPFRLKTWQHDKQLTLERNEQYHAPATGVKTIAIYMIEEWVTAENLYKSGKIDYVDGIAATEVPTYEKREDFHRTPRLAVTFLGFNVSKPPTDNPLVRKAIGLAVDRAEIIRLLDSGRTILNGMTPKGLMVEGSDSAIEFNPVRARELLKQAGFTAAKPLKLLYKFTTSEDAKRMAENLQSQLKKNLGADVDVKGVDFKTFIGEQKSDPPSVFPFGWAADYPDPSVYFGLFTSTSRNNYLRWKNLAYDGLVEKGASAESTEARRAIYRQAQGLALEQDTVLFPLYNNTIQYLLASRVSGFFVNPRGIIEFQKVSVH